MDLKTSFKNYCQMRATEKHISSVKDSLRILSESGIPYEIRTTVVPGLHNTEVIQSMGPTIRKHERYILQNFEPNGTVDPSYKDTNPFSAQELARLLKAAQSFNPKATVRDQ